MSQVEDESEGEGGGGGGRACVEAEAAGETRTPTTLRKSKRPRTHRDDPVCVTPATAQAAQSLLSLMR
jgi:hypothetical protein